jgi:hypothetical protein
VLFACPTINCPQVTRLPEGVASANGARAKCPAAEVARPGRPLSSSSQHYNLPAAAEGVGDVLGAIANKLPGLGYTGVAVAEDVHGFKGDFLLAVQFLHVGAKLYWQVIAVGGGGSSTAAHAEINEVANVIKNLSFL